MLPNPPIVEYAHFLYFTRLKKKEIKNTFIAAPLPVFHMSPLLSFINLAFFNCKCLLCYTIKTFLFQLLFCFLILLVHNNHHVIVSQCVSIHYSIYPLCRRCESVVLVTWIVQQRVCDWSILCNSVKKNFPEEMLPPGGKDLTLHIGGLQAAAILTDSLLWQFLFRHILETKTGEFDYLS